MFQLRMLQTPLGRKRGITVPSKVISLHKNIVSHNNNNNNNNKTALYVNIKFLNKKWEHIFYALNN